MYGNNNVTEAQTALILKKIAQSHQGYITNRNTLLARRDAPLVPVEDLPERLLTILKKLCEGQNA